MTEPPTEIDAWINQQGDADFTQPEAVRHLIEETLPTEPTAKKK